MHTCLIHQMRVYIHRAYMTYSPNVSLRSPCIHDLFTKCVFTFATHDLLTECLSVYIHQLALSAVVLACSQ